MVQRGGVDIDPADVARPAADRVDLAHALGHILRAVAGVLAEDQDQPLVPLGQQGLDLGAEFVLAQRPADLRLVGAAKCAVLAVVAALVAHVQRGKQHDAVAVHVALELPGRLKNLLHEFRLLGRQEHGRLLDGQGLLGHALGDQLADFRRIGLAVQQAQQEIVVDEVEAALAQLGSIRHPGHRAPLYRSAVLA